MADSALTSLNTATVKQQWNLRQCIDGCVRHGIQGIAPWRDILHAMGVDEAARAIKDSGLRVTGLCRGGMFPGATPAQRQANLDDNRKAVDEAVALNAECLVLVVGGLPDGSKDIAAARGQVRDGIAYLLEYARSCNMPLAIEPLHPMYAADRACVNTMAHANDLCDELGPGLGIAVDVYHLWWDPDLEQQIKRAGRERLLAFHVCDWLVPTQDLLLDRGMMGDGIIDIPLIRSWMEKQGYHGLIEVEIFSAGNWWKREADEVLKVMKQRIREAV
ncbi:MAG: sugar phosphate isomerase/epimerase [Gammaproteobacteria bacterium]|nr:sugar phosphate isomerase/epimerase [Gammaproteobacteria bacterium]